MLPLWAAMLVWLLVWALYLSIVNVGQLWYSFGWESLLLEAGFLTVFLGNDEVGVPVLVLFSARWLVFRVEFGAGLIKLRGDRCWRDLTCLRYHHETQPMPGPLSWFFHHLPRPLHRVEAAGNHVAQLIVPFGLFAPQPVAGVAAAIIVVTQLWLVLSGNFAWLNWLTIVLACSGISDSILSVETAGQLRATEPPTWFVAFVLMFTALIVALSYWPVRNMLSRRQRMNASFNSLRLVNTYGAFGSVTRTRDELVIEGTDEAVISDHTVWREYEFKGKPGVVTRSAPPVGSLPSAAGLVDVVCRIVSAIRLRVAAPVDRQTARQRPGDASAAAPQSLPRHRAGVRSRPALPLPIQHLARTAEPPSVVAS